MTADAGVERARPEEVQPLADDADRRVVRRAVVAGASTWLGVGGVLLAGVLLGRGRGREGLVVVLLALVLGALVTAGWLLLSIILDLVAGATPGRRRVAWAAGAFAFAFVAPMLVLGAAGA